MDTDADVDASTRTGGVILAVFVVCILSVGGLAVAASASGTYAIDGGHELASDGAVDEYRNEGYVTTDVQQLDLQLSIAAHEDDLGIQTPRADLENHYVCADYGETIPRDVRVHIPKGFWHPFSLDSHESVTDETTMTMRPTADGNHSAVTFSFGEETRACFEISRQASVFFSARDWSRDAVEEQTGFSPPSVSGEADSWDYLPPEAFQETDGHVALEVGDGDLTLQYNADVEVDGEDWRTVPKCGSVLPGSSSANVCYYERAAAIDADAGNESILLVAQTSTPPEVRFQHDRDYGASAWASVREARDAIGKALQSARETISSLFGAMGPLVGVP